MSLTYQPFAELPEVTALGNELKHNVSDMERYGSIAAGAGILLGAFFGHGIGRLLLLGAAGALVHRGITGHCHVYDKLGVRTRTPERPSPQEPAESRAGAAQKPVPVS
jgi:hypothetical protein